MAQLLSSDTPAHMEAEVIAILCARTARQQLELNRIVNQLPYWGHLTYSEKIVREGPPEGMELSKITL